MTGQTLRMIVETDRMTGQTDRIAGQTGWQDRQIG